MGIYAVVHALCQCPQSTISVNICVHKLFLLQKYLLVNVPRESREFKRILRRVEVTYPNFGYNNPQISRIQNVHLWERYALWASHFLTIWYTLSFIIIFLNDSYQVSKMLASS